MYLQNLAAPIGWTVHEDININSTRRREDRLSEINDLSHVMEDEVVIQNKLASNFSSMMECGPETWSY